MQFEYKIYIYLNSLSDISLLYTLTNRFADDDYYSHSIVAGGLELMS